MFTEALLETMKNVKIGKQNIGVLSLIWLVFFGAAFGFVLWKCPYGFGGSDERARGCIRKAHACPGQAVDGLQGEGRKRLLACQQRAIQVGNKKRLLIHTVTPFRR